MNSCRYWNRTMPKSCGKGSENRAKNKINFSKMNEMLINIEKNEK